MGIGEGMDKCAHACAPRGLVVPMDWNEDPAWDLRGGDVDTQHGTPVRRANLGEPVSGEAELRCIVRVHLDEGIGQVTSEFRREAGAGHRVPLVAYPPGVQKEGKVRVRRFCQAGSSMAMKRARRESVKKRPSANIRFVPPAPPTGAGHCSGASAS
jgi:hypothetical protein